MIGDKAFVALRNKLNCLHYCQPLTHESCALVERVLGDLLATTELYQRTKLRAETAESQITHEQIALMPLKKENARVVRENNGLHKEIIQVKENLSQNDNSWQRQYKQIESEYNDIKQAFLAKNYKIKELEKRNSKLEERLDSIMSKAYKPDVKKITPALVPSGESNDIGKHIYFSSIIISIGAKQNLELAYMLEKTTSREISGPEEENLLNQICAADERVQIITKELSLYRQFKDEAEERIRELESMVQQRDREISRLNNLYMGADNLDKMNIDFIEKDNSETISKLNAQLDYINKENNKLHQVIGDLRIKNKGNAGMYYENRKVVDRIEALKKKNDDLRRINENSEKVIQTLKERETDLSQKLSHKYILKEKYEETLQIIDLQQQDIVKLKKLVEVTENQRKIETHVKLASQQEELDYEPEKEQVSQAEASKIKKEKEKLMKKNETLRNEVNAISGKYLGSQRKLELLHEEYKNMKSRVKEGEENNLILRQELIHKDKEIEVMIEYLKDAQPMGHIKGKENDNVKGNDAHAYFGSTKKDRMEPIASKDPEQTKKMFDNVAHFGDEN
jgi:centrosomal protein CEP135